MGSLFYHIGGIEVVIAEGHFNISANCMKEVMALDYTPENEMEYAQILMEYGTVLVTLMEMSAIPHSVISNLKLMRQPLFVKGWTSIARTRTIRIKSQCSGIVMRSSCSEKLAI